MGDDVLVKYILVSGLIPYDSGKTWFTLGSALYAKSSGLKVAVYKPVAGHSAWYSPETMVVSKKLRLLVGHDVSLYYKHGLIEDVASSNPVALMTLPPDPLKYTELERYFSELEDTYSMTVLSRITSCRNNATRHYFYPDNIGKLADRLARAVNRLIDVLGAERSTIDHLISTLTAPSISEELDVCLDRVSIGKDLVFIESFNDAVAPYMGGLFKASVLVIVAPSKILVYCDLHEVREFVKILTEKMGWSGYRSRYIVASFKPIKVFEAGFVKRPSVMKWHVAFIEYLLKECL